jgi:predicted HTH domain antitoxin
MKTVTLEIPTDAANETELARLLRLELGLAVYRHGILSPGRAAELAGLGRWEFGDIAKSRGVNTPYTEEMVEEDFANGDRH